MVEDLELGFTFFYKTLLYFELQIIILQFWTMLQFIPATLTLDSGVTRPPPLLSEADLLSCMDKVRRLEFQLFLFWLCTLYVSSLFSHNCIILKLRLLPLLVFVRPGLVQMQQCMITLKSCLIDSTSQRMQTLASHLLIL